MNNNCLCSFTKLCLSIQWLGTGVPDVQDDPRAAAYGPETLRAMGMAFDKAWAVINPEIPEREVPLARDMLADAIMSAAAEDCHDPERLKKAALVVMACGKSKMGPSSA